MFDSQLSPSVKYVACYAIRFWQRDFINCQQESFTL